MYEIFTNPSTLLCLGITFLLISLLFFYFKRSISVIEKTQLEQVRMLHQFIANTEMQMNSNNKIHTNSNNYPAPSVNNNANYTNEPNSELIDVSDGEDESDSDESDGDESDSDESDGDESEIDKSTIELGDNNSIKEIEVVDIGDPIQHLDTETGVTDIKVIQLQEDDSKEELEIENLENSDESDDDSDDIDDTSDSDDEIDIKINKESTNNLENLMKVKDIKEEVTVKETLKTNYKSLNVTSLRQIAEENGLIEKGEKKNKKELLELLG